MIGRYRVHNGMMVVSITNECLHQNVAWGHTEATRAVDMGARSETLREFVCWQNDSHAKLYTARLPANTAVTIVTLRERPKGLKRRTP